MKRKIIFIFFYLMVNIILGNFVFAQEMLEEETDLFTPKETEEKDTFTAKAEENDIVQTMPLGQFVHPKEGMDLTEKIEIRFEITHAISVEFYLRRPEALVEIYLGQGVLREKDIWGYSWQTDFVPNGSYYLFPKIINEYGRYSGSRIYINVKNEIIKEEEAIWELEEEMEKSATEIQDQEYEVIEAEGRIKEEIVAEVEGLIEGAEKIISEEDGELKSEIEQKVKDFSQEVVEEIEKVLESPEEEEREGSKEKISENIGEITDLITEGSEEEKKGEALELEEKTQENIDKLIQEAEEVYRKKQEIEAKKEELFAKDSDNDGLPDYEEIRLGTDPFNPDSDQDGFLDGTEIVLGYDPLNPSPAEKIKYQDPRGLKVKISEVVKIEKVELVFSEEVGRDVLKIQGKALPYSFVTIYIFSLPIVVVTKTDGNGNWEYILDKPLADGQHVVYATVTNNKGEIEESSKSLEFTKMGDKILRLFAAGGTEIASPVEVFEKSFIILIIATIVFASGVALIMVGVFLRKKVKV